MDRILASQKVRDSRCSQIIGVVPKDVEQVPSQNLLTLGHGGPQIGIADSHDVQSGSQDEVQPGGGLKQSSKVRIWKGGDLVRQGILVLQGIMHSRVSF
jgi:hypothetical protein